MNKIMENYLVFDIETIPDDMADELKPECPLGNAKKAETIERLQVDWKGSEKQIKTMSVNPLMNKIICVGFKKSTNKPFSIYEKEYEKLLLMEFWEEIRRAMSYEGGNALIVGFNIQNFDWPTLLFRSMINSIELPSGLPPFKRYTNYPYYDVRMELTQWDSRAKGSLDWLSQRIGQSGKEHDGSEIYNLWKKNDSGAIRAHCKDDCLKTAILFKKMVPYYPPLENINRKGTI